MSSSDEQLRRTLAEQEAELQKLDARLAEYRPLHERRNNIHTLVSQIRFMLGMEPYRGPEQRQPVAGPLAATTTKDRPIWAVAHDVLKRAKRPMSTTELAEALYGLGFKQLVGRLGRETVRTLLVKKKDVFEKLADGRFTLKKPE